MRRAPCCSNGGYSGRIRLNAKGRTRPRPCKNAIIVYAKCDGRLNDPVAGLVGKIVAKSPYALAIGEEAFYCQAELGLAWPMPAPARS